MEIMTRCPICLLEKEESIKDEIYEVVLQFSGNKRGETMSKCCPECLEKHYDRNSGWGESN